MIECDRGVVSFFAVMYNQNIDIITHTYNAAILKMKRGYSQTTFAHRSDGRDFN